MCLAASRGKKRGVFVAADCHPQTIAVVQSRCEAVGAEVHVGDPDDTDVAALDVAGVLLQYPDSCGRIRDHGAWIEALHAAVRLARLLGEDATRYTKLLDRARSAVESFWSEQHARYGFAQQ